MYSNKILFATILLFPSCKEKKQEVTQFEETKSETSATYLDHDTLQQSKSLITTKNDRDTVKDKTTFDNKTKNDNSNISFLGIWKTKCNTDDHISNVVFYNKSEGELSMYNNTKLVSKMMVEISPDHKLLKYIGTNIIGDGVDVKKITTLTKGDVIAEIETINENKISIHWLGFEKEKLFIKKPFSQESSITLTKCSE